MTKKWIAITTLLLVITCLLGWQLRASMLRFYSENDLAKLQPVKDAKQRIVPESPPAKPVQPQKYNPAEFSMVPENNVFSESRTKEEKLEVMAPPEPPPLAQKPILVGVTILDNEKRASIIDPTNPQQGKTRRAEIKRIGDVFHGYTITEITTANIVLESGTRREIIPLHEGSKRSQGGKTPILSTRVVSFGGGSSGGTPVTVASGASVRAAAAPAASSPQPSPPVGIAPAPAQQRTTTVTTPQATTRQARQQAPAAQQRDAQGRRVIRTPFGTIVRPDRD
ncbi:MAG: hypothetical protein JXA73_24855 [Acidobacteria bacterium]|nr:hypothetical protein [Acidobacteriota bacterium]